MPLVYEGAAIGTVLPTQIPDVSDPADIRNALKIFYYGDSRTAPASEGDLLTNSIAGRLSNLGSTKLNINNPTTTGKLTTAASASGSAGLNLPQGSAPSSPVNGDIWTTTTGLFARIQGSTQQYIDINVGSLNSLISIDNSTSTHTLQIAYGATTSGQTKTVNIAGGGVSGSTTSITLGSSVGTTITLNGAVSAPSTLSSPSITASTTLTVNTATIKSGSAAPTSTGEPTGSMYLRTGQTADATLYIRSTSGSSPNWSAVRGSKWFSGSASPSTGIGEQPGDYYLNYVTGEFWVAS